jgi:ADP-ribosylglycohydrolase
MLCFPLLYERTSMTDIAKVPAGESHTITNYGGRKISLADRVRGALWGSLTGDAFCLGSHWIYGLYEIERKFPGGIRGFETPETGQFHYGKKSGDLTHYGDTAMVMLASVAANGRFDAADFGARLIEMIADEKNIGYRDHAMKGILANYRKHRETHPEVPFDYQQGADDDQPATVTHLAPVVAAHLCDPNLLETVEKTTLVCQNNSRAVAFAKATALIMRHLFNGLDPETAVTETRHAMHSQSPAHREVNTRMKVACSAQMLSPVDATLLFGESCPLYSSFTAALHTTLTCKEDFVGAITATAQAGGDNAGRAAMIGAWLGAYHGIGAVPESWCLRLTAYKQIKADVERIASCVSLDQ